MTALSLQKVDMDIVMKEFDLIISKIPVKFVEAFLSYDPQTTATVDVDEVKRQIYTIFCLVSISKYLFLQWWTNFCYEKQVAHDQHIFGFCGFSTDGDTINAIIEELEKTQNQSRTIWENIFKNKSDSKTATFLQNIEEFRHKPDFCEAQWNVCFKNFWNPAMKLCNNNSLKSPVSRGVIFAACMFLGINAVEKGIRSVNVLPPSKGGEEGAETLWITEFLTSPLMSRYDWVGMWRSIVDDDNLKSLSVSLDHLHYGTTKFQIDFKEELTGNILQSNQILKSGDFLQSNNRNYKAFVNDNGALVVTTGALPERDTTKNHFELYMESLGNLVIRKIEDTKDNPITIWQSNTGTNKSRGHYLKLHSGGVLVIYDKNNEKIWSSKTHVTESVALVESSHFISFIASTQTRRIIKPLLYNIGIVGDSGAGKTRLLRELTFSEFRLSIDLRTHVVDSRFVTYRKITNNINSPNSSSFTTTWEDIPFPIFGYELSSDNISSDEIKHIDEKAISTYKSEYIKQHKEMYHISDEIIKKAALSAENNTTSEKRLRGGSITTYECVPQVDDDQEMFPALPLPGRTCIRFYDMGGETNSPICYNRYLIA